MDGIQHGELDRHRARTIRQRQRNRVTRDRCEQRRLPRWTGDHRRADLHGHSDSGPRAATTRSDAGANSDADSDTAGANSDADSDAAGANSNASGSRAHPHSDTACASAHSDAARADAASADAARADAHAGAAGPAAPRLLGKNLRLVGPLSDGHVHCGRTVHLRGSLNQLQRFKVRRLEERPLGRWRRRPAIERHDQGDEDLGGQMNTNRKSRGAAVALAMTICAVRPAHAQTLEDVLTFLVTNQSVQTGSIERDRAAAQATSVTISRALLANLATLPVASSSGAFVYRFNPELGTFGRPTQTFGPFFLERALTAGRGNASFGVTFQQFRFTSLDGRNLRDGSLVTTANQFRDEVAPFDIDQLTLDIDASVATLYGTVGVTNHMEVGFAAPYISLNIDGSRVNTYRGRTFTQASGSGRATGLADMLVRTKYTLYDDESTALAAAVDLRLPTGRQEDLLGAGSASIKFTAIGSVEAGRWSAHANAGVTRGGLANELSYGAGLAVAASGRLSVVGELLGRYIDSSGHILSITAPHPTLTGVNTIRLTGDQTSLQILNAVPGFKWNLSSTWVLAGNVSIPLTNGGLTAPFTPFLGLDYALGR